MDRSCKYLRLTDSCITAGVLFRGNRENNMGKNNPRYKNGSLRRKLRERLRALELPCHICGQPIHYDEPSDHLHPLSFVVDEVIPVSKWKEFGYSSPEQVAQDWNNLAPAHYICNQRKSDKINYIPRRHTQPAVSVEKDGEW